MTEYFGNSINLLSFEEGVDSLAGLNKIPMRPVHSVYMIQPAVYTGGSQHISFLQSDHSINVAQTH